MYPEDIKVDISVRPKLVLQPKPKQDPNFRLDPQFRPKTKRKAI